VLIHTKSSQSRDILWKYGAVLATPRSGMVSHMIIFFSTLYSYSIDIHVRFAEADFGVHYTFVSYRRGVGHNVYFSLRH